MDMAVTDGPLWAWLVSPKGFTAIAHAYWMNCTSLWLDIGGGLLIAEPFRPGSRRPFGRICS